MTTETGRPLDPSSIDAQTEPADAAAAGSIVLIRDMTTHAHRLGKLGSLFAHVAEWYRANIDADAFKAGGPLGPKAP